MIRDAINYARALYSLAEETGQQKQILEEMAALARAVKKEPDYLRLLDSPALSNKARCTVIEKDFCGSFAPYLMNLMKLLTEKRRMCLFAACYKAYCSIYDNEHGVLPVTAVTAVALSEAQRKRLTDKMTGITGKTVTIINQMDPNVLGGVRLDYNGIRIDGTLRNRLDVIEQMLKNTVL